MSNKYPRRPKVEPLRKECAKQKEFEDRSFDLRIFNFLKDNLEIKIEKFRETHGGPDINVVKLCLTNPISGEIEEICKEYE